MSAQLKTSNHSFSHVNIRTRPSLLNYCAASLWMLIKRLLRGNCKLQYFTEESPLCGLIQEIGINSLSPALDPKNPRTPTAGIEAAAGSEELKDSQVRFS